MLGKDAAGLGSRMMQCQPNPLVSRLNALLPGAGAQSKGLAIILHHSELTKG